MRANGVAWLTGYAAAVRSWLAILVTLAACNESDADRLHAIRDQMCACKTASCAEQAMSHVPKHTIPSTPRIRAIAREMVECMARLQSAERPSTDPDAEGGGNDSTEDGSAAAKPAQGQPPAAAPAPDNATAPAPGKAAPVPAPAAAPTTR